MNDLLIQALKGQNRTGKAPIWLMRQAGRYLPEYRALREKHSFHDLCRRPELAVEVTKLPLRLLDFDAAILFSDILWITELLGCRVQFEEGRGPIVESPYRLGADLAFPEYDVGQQMDYVMDTIGQLRQELTVPLIGFSGAPFTLASYIAEGGTSREFTVTKRWLFEDPASFHQLLSKLCDLVEEYLRQQVMAGAQAIQIFDSWAHCLAYPQFREFSLHYLRRLVAALKPLGVPVILFCRGASLWAEELAAARPAALGVDWNGDLAQVRRRVSHHIALQGNLDPQVLLGPKEAVMKEASRLLWAMGDDPGFIFNLGHGVLPQTPVENVRALIETVRAGNIAPREATV